MARESRAGAAGLTTNVSGSCPPLARAFLRWQRAAGPFWPFVCAAPFLSDLQPRPVRRRASSVGAALLDHLPPLDQDDRFAALLDLPIEPTLAVADQLNAAGLIVVPVVQRWSAQPAVLDCRLLLGLLLDQAGRQCHLDSPRGILFLLDGERSVAPSHLLPGRSVSPRAFDNRYTYRSCRFPNAATLIEAGYNDVLWLSNDGVAADLSEYATSLVGAGLSLTEVQCTLF
jgi:hypothetical protein